MNKVLLFAGIFVIIILGGFFIYQNLSNHQEPPKNEEENIADNQQPEEFTTLMKALENKKIAMVIAFRNFRDAEYFVPKEVLETAGAQITTVSNKSGTAVGADGGEVEVDLLLSELEVANFNAVILVGGPGALQYLDNQDSYKVAQETITQNKLLAAICIAPAILAKAGVLQGKRATVWTSAMDKSAAKILEDNGAFYEDKSVIVDGGIVTGSGPAAAQEFGEAIKELLTLF
jgi:protease I